ncbi:pentatricopeptide repeat-containing protein [Canna indica]|uniref:Pentatricopeptide repeat-containing protein n=1 Tax=Canna indica TaxID=4628 RepID=A0AAQ3QR75_9LILI|nr:pentatricopeptide repeat-containing protein [Canna indica]
MPKFLNRLPSSLGKSRSTTIGHNAYNWNIILRGFLEGNAPNKVILAYALMRRKRVKVDSFTILFVIKACGVIMQKVLGKQVHAQVTKLGFQQEVVTQTAILQMYGLFGDIEAADKLFGETPKRDIVQWNALLAMYSQRNRPYSTIKVAQRMVSESVRPNEVTVVSIISACSHLKALAEGKQWHGYIIKHLAVLDTFVHNALVNMYAICGCLSDAEKIFKILGNRNAVSWTTMINAYGASGYLKEALELFKKMEAVGETPDEVTMLAVVSICAKLGRFDLGEWIDDYIKRFGLYENIHIANALIDMHSKCGRIEKSCRIFGKMTRRTLITWTAMIRGLAMHGHGQTPSTRLRYCDSPHDSTDSDPSKGGVGEASPRPKVKSSETMEGEADSSGGQSEDAFKPIINIKIPEQPVVQQDFVDMFNCL